MVLRRKISPSNRSTSISAMHPFSESPAAAELNAPLQEKRENTALLFPLLDQILYEILILGPDERIVFANEPAARALGHPLSEVLHKPLKSFLKIKTDLEPWKKVSFQELRKKKKNVVFMVERTSTDGTIRSLEVTAKYLRHRGGEYVLFLARDLTETVSLQNELRECVDCHRLLNEQAAAGIFMLDLDGRVLYANKTAKSLAGIAHQDVKVFHFANLIEPDCRKKAAEIFQSVKGGTAVIGEELIIVSAKEKTTPVEVTASPIRRDGEIRQIHLILRDVSARKHYEELERESEKIKAVQNLISGTTQELFYPVKGLLDHLQGLWDKYKERDFEYIGYKEFKDLISNLEIMRDQARDCFKTINRLIILNKGRVGLHEYQCDVNHVIRETLKMLDPQFKRSDIKVKLKLASQLPVAAIGSLELSQVFVNVLNNALQAMPSNGDVHVKTTHRKAEDIIQIDCLDEGEGIPKENLPRVFDPFFTTRGRGPQKSTGLGLSIVYSVLKTCGGDIFIKSSLQKGTHVRILLPISKNISKSEAVSSPHTK